MKLNNSELKNKEVWESKGYKIISYDRDKVIETTHNNPTWVHFGAGNIFRIFPAKLCQRLIESGDMSTGIVVGEGFDYEIISKAYAPFDNMTLMVTLKADGTIDKEVIGIHLTISLKRSGSALTKLSHLLHFRWCRLQLLKKDMRLKILKANIFLLMLRISKTVQERVECFLAV